MTGEHDLHEFEATRIELSGAALNVIDVGTGPAVLLLHGFPDRATMWRYQIRALVDAGHRVIAPDLRGFGDSDRPADPAAYSLDALTTDVTDLLDHCGVDQVSIAAHDWGGPIGWGLAATQPDRVRHLGALSVGHPEAFMGAGLEQKQLSWYMLWFQFQAAEEQLPLDDWALYRRWIHGGIARGQDPDVDRQLADLERPGALVAGLNWYRANMPPEVFAQDSFGVELPPVGCPVLAIHGEHDPALSERQIIESKKYVTGPWRYVKLAGVGHFFPVTAPERVNELLTEFFA
jgi:pimeloyl-ACP methyl ester carboxylesterase